jgi:hypothetical protein
LIEPYDIAGTSLASEAGQSQTLPATASRAAYRLPLLFWLGLLALAGTAVTASLIMTSTFPLTADEGLYITWGRLLAAGYAPYTEVYLTNPPLSPLFLDLAWRVGGSPATMKLALLAFWGVGLLAIALLANELSGDWRAGLAAALLLGFSVQYFAESQTILMVIFSIMPGILALWLAMLYQRNGNLLALIGSALLTAISLEIKLLSPFLPPLVYGVVLTRHVALPQLWTILRRPELRRNLLRVSLIWGGALLFLPLLSLLIWDANAMLYGAVLQRLSAREAYPPDLGESVYARGYKLLVVYVAGHRSLIGLGLLGLALAFWSKQRGRWLALAWLAGAAGMLLFHNPLYQKHFALLSAPLAVAAAFLVPLATRPNRGLARTLLVGLIGVGWLSFAAEFVGQWPDWRALAQAPDPPPAQRPAVDFIRAVTTPGDCVITDYSQLLLWSERLPPPPLSEVSSSRLRSGFLTTAELIDIAGQYDCPVVAALTGRIRRTSLDFIKWAEAHYRGLYLYTADGQLLHFGKPIAAAKVAQAAVPLTARFAADETVALELLGYEALPDTARPGAALPLKLFWRPSGPPPLDYTIFVQFRNGSGVTVANADHQPYLGLLPFSRWGGGEVLAETTWLHLPPDLTPGPYHLFVGLYDQATWQRLPLQPDTSGENALLLKTITVAR